MDLPFGQEISSPELAQGRATDTSQPTDLYRENGEMRSVHESVDVGLKRVYGDEWREARTRTQR